MPLYRMLLHRYSVPIVASGTAPDDIPTDEWR